MVHNKFKNITWQIHMSLDHCNTFKLYCQGMILQLAGYTKDPELSYKYH